MFESIQEILIIVTLLLGIVGTVAGWFKSDKAKKIAKNSITLKEQVEKYVQVAEELSETSGPEKKQYVLTKIKEEAEKQGFNFDADQVSSLIEDLIKITRKVNITKEEKE